MATKCPKCQTENPDTQRFCGDCGTQLPFSKEVHPEATETLQTAIRELTTGSTFAGRYQIIEELGKGGMGRVYRAIDKKLNEEVAIKLIKPEIAVDRKTLERFHNELKLARKISHRNVGRMYELMEEKDAHFITMEYVPGQDLRGLIRQTGQLTVGKALSIARQVGEGLAEAHRLGIVHRDLKPSNIIIDKEGNTRIMDFGIARSLKARSITGDGVMIGTPEYMSPEQVEGKEVDQRSDIYSLGIVLYEMLTGQVPFAGDTPFTVGVKQKSEVPRDPKELNTQIPPDLGRLVLKCLEKDKGKRYETAAALNTDLERIEQALPTTERLVQKHKPLTSREITVKFRLKNLLVPSLVLLAVIVIALAIWQTAGKKKILPAAGGKPSLAVLYFKNNTGDANFEIWRSAVSDSIITDLQQSKYINVLGGDRIFSILKKLGLLEANTYASEDLKSVAAEGRANHILQGSFSKAGEIFRIEYTLLDIGSGKIIGSDRVQGRGEDSLFSMIDELTRKVKADFDLSPVQIADDLDKSLGEILTGSTEAYRYFLEGRRLGLAGDNRGAIVLHEKALAIDPEFATCYDWMASAYSNLGYLSESNKYRQKALELSDRLSDRERLRISGNYYYFSEETYDKAAEAYKKLLELYPDDATGNNMLGNLYQRMGDWDKAVKQYEINVRNRVEGFIYHSNLAYQYMRLDQFDKAREVLENYTKDFGDSAGTHMSLSDCYLYQGKIDLAVKEAEKAYSLDPEDYRTFSYLGEAYLYLGEFQRAEKAYLSLLESGEPSRQAAGMRRLAALYLGQGKYEKARDQAKAAISAAEKVGELSWQANFHQYLGYIQFTSGNLQEAFKEIDISKEKADEGEQPYFQRASHFMKGVFYALSNSTDEASREAVIFKERTEKSPWKRQLRLYDYLMGVIELQKENYSKAIEYLKNGLALEAYGPLARPAHIVYQLASAYYRSGDLPKAQEEFEGITKLTTGRLWWGDMVWGSNAYAKSFYMLGKIHEEQGDKEQSRDNYQKFLDLWKDADPGIAEMEDARKRLAGLSQ